MSGVFPPDDDSEVVIVRRIVAVPPEAEALEPETAVAADADLGEQPGIPTTAKDAPAERAGSKDAGSKGAGSKGDAPMKDAPSTGGDSEGAASKDAGSDAPIEPKRVKVVSIARDEDLDPSIPLPIGDDAPLDSESRPAVAVDPRLRERRQEVDRLITRKRLFVGIGIFTVLLLVVGTIAVFASTIFDVRTITVYGNVYTTDDQLAPVLANLRGKPILTVDINKARGQIEALPFVKQADIATDFPHTVHIEIEERQPALSYIGTDGQWRIIDSDGRVLTLLGGQPADYKPVNGVGPAIDAGGFAGPGYSAAATISRSLPSELQPYMASFNVKSTGDIDLVLITGTVVSFGQPTDMTAKLAAVLTKFRSTPPSKVAAIDVSNPAAVGVTLK